MIKTVAYLALVGCLTCSCMNSRNGQEELTRETIENPTNQVILSSEIVWEKLNPARGDQSPQAGTIWGDRNGEVATGFLAKFVDGFSSPPHIHNVSYRAIVIKGLIHNDDPKAEFMWMKPGSFWTQPAGEAHITAAKGNESIALVEIDEGPYLVKPTSEAFDNGERPMNIDVSNITWLTNSSTNWIDSKSSAEISFLSQTVKSRSLFIKLPKGYDGMIETNGTTLHAVLIKGELSYYLPDNETKVLDLGSYFGSSDKTIHHVSNHSTSELIIYVRTNGAVQVN